MKLEREGEGWAVVEPPTPRRDAATRGGGIAAGRHGDSLRRDADSHGFGRDDTRWWFAGLNLGTGAYLEIGSWKFDGANRMNQG